MPSRLQHELLEHILRTADMTITDPQTSIQFEMTSDGYFNQTHMLRPTPNLTLRTIVREEVMYDLPAQECQEFLRVLEGWVRSRDAINVSEHFKEVRLLRVDRMVNPSSFGMDLRMEFSMPYENYEPPPPQYTFPDHPINPIRNPNNVQIGKIWGQKTIQKKKEKHFEDDLFEL